MIKNFKDTPTRNTGIVNKGMLEQIKMLHTQSPELAGELAISFIELVLTGQASSDDFTIQFALANHSIVAEKNAEKYDKKVAADRAARIEKLKLVEISDMLKNGASQKVIADTLNESPAVIHYRVNVIKADFPELLSVKN